MKPEQAPIEIAKELRELNKKLDKIIDILKFSYGLIPAREVMTTGDIVRFQNPPTIGDPCPNPYEITCSSGNPEAHDYGTEYINVLKECITPDAKSRIDLPSENSQSEH